MLNQKSQISRAPRPGSA